MNNNTFNNVASTYNLGNNSLIDPILINQFLPISDAVSEILEPTTL